MQKIKQFFLGFGCVVAIASGCGCQGPITRQDYKLEKTKKGYDLGTKFWGFRFGWGEE